MSGSRSSDRLLCEEGVWIVITAIVWVARLCVDHCIEMIMKCLNVLYVNHSPLILLRCVMRVKLLFGKRCFLCFQTIVAMTINNQ